MVSARSAALGLLEIALVFSTGLHAETIQQSYSGFVGAPPYGDVGDVLSTTFSVQPFQSSLGTLNDLVLSEQTQFELSYGLVSFCFADGDPVLVCPPNTYGSQTYQVDATGGITGLTSQTLGYGGYIGNLIVDCGGRLCNGAEPIFNFDSSVTISSSDSIYSGNSPVDVSAYAGESNFIANGGGFFLYSTNSFGYGYQGQSYGEIANFDLTVTYDYTPTVPEPRLLVLTALCSLGLVIVGRRRITSKQ